jgi:sigma-E factor negative regulatory protein RseA
MQEQPSARDEPDPRPWLSALVDGEADAAEAARGLAAWADSQPLARQRWHLYQLIGDVLRSEDLASAPDHDARFLRRLRGRLDREPALLAPQRLPAAPSAAARRASWLMPTALAASVMGLATVLTVWLQPAIRPSGAAGLVVASAPAATVAAADPARIAAVASSEDAASGARVLRDARLDRYLQAHREYATALPGSLPGGAGRSINTVSFDR